MNRNPLDLPLVVDSTILSTFRACEEKGALEYVEGLAPSALGLDLHAGACIATALETLYDSIFYRNLSVAAALGATEIAFDAAWGDFEIPQYKLDAGTAKTKERCFLAILDYASHYHPPHDHLLPYPGVEKATEFSFGIPLTRETTGLDFPLHPSGDPFIYAGRFDMLGLYHGLPVVRDDKTCSSIGARWHDSWSLRAQFMGYCWAMRVLGIPLECVIVRGICIQKTQFKQVEAEKRFPSHLLDRWLRVIRSTLERFVRAAETGDWQYSFGTECTAYNGCPFLDLCTAPDPDQWKGDFSRRRWNPLTRGA